MSLEELLPILGKTREQALISPLAKDQTVPSYEYFRPENIRSRVDNPTRTIVIQSTYVTRRGHRYCLFADGHVETVSDEELKRPKGWRPIL